MICWSDSYSTPLQVTIDQSAPDSALLHKYDNWNHTTPGDAHDPDNTTTVGDQLQHNINTSGQCWRWQTHNGPCTSQHVTVHRLQTSQPWHDGMYHISTVCH